MRVLMFKDRFAGLVARGEKRQTVRRRANCEPGAVLSLRRWTGKAYRSKQELLGEAVCAWVRPVLIAPGLISLDGDFLAAREADTFARADGFSGAGELWDWFGEEYGSEPFLGEVIGWL